MRRLFILLFLLCALPAHAFTFAALGDNRPFLPGGGQPSAFKAILKDLEQERPAFAVNTGDCIFGSSNRERFLRQYADYEKALALYSGKVYLALGNHELRNLEQQEFFSKEFGSPYYSFDYDDSRFIVLDSEMVGQVGRIAGEQRRWLESELARSRTVEHVFVFMHRPMYPVDGHRGSSMDMYPKERDSLHALFVKYHVTAVFMGHEHLFDLQKRNGVCYVITGGAGAPIYQSSKNSGEYYHYVMVSVEGPSVKLSVVRPRHGGAPRWEKVVAKL
ncbi:MAG: metallophosphoesterase family protein [Armatimonadota bacterium]